MEAVAAYLEPRSGTLTTETEEDHATSVTISHKSVWVSMVKPRWIH
jgi:hypothetical protein